MTAAPCTTLGDDLHHHVRRDAQRALCGRATVPQMGDDDVSLQESAWWEAKRVAKRTPCPACATLAATEVPMPFPGIAPKPGSTPPAFERGGLTRFGAGEDTSLPDDAPATPEDLLEEAMPYLEKDTAAADLVAKIKAILPPESSEPGEAPGIPAPAAG